jgi:hypothetical protein
MPASANTGYLLEYSMMLEPAVGKHKPAAVSRGIGKLA